jgi:hypothetical protein
MSQVMQFPIEIGGDLAIDNQIESDHIDTAESAISGVVAELFPNTATAEPIALWERRVGVSPESGDSLATRRSRVCGAYAARGGQSKAYFEGVALQYGKTITITDGEYLWIKYTLDVDNGAGGHDVKFYTAADQATEPTTWTQLGSTVTTAGTTSVWPGTAGLIIGGRSATTQVFNGSLARVIIRNGIGGNTVLDFYATAATTHSPCVVQDQRRA